MSRPESPLSDTILGRLPAKELEKKPPYAGLSNLVVRGPSDDPLHQAVRVAAGQEPDRAARVLRLQASTGLPSRVIDRNLDEVERHASVANFDAQRFRRESPIVARWLMESPEHTALAQDDFEALSS